jgi:hypothetical protein
MTDTVILNQCSVLKRKYSELVTDQLDFSKDSGVNVIKNDLNPTMSII